MTHDVIDTYRCNPVTSDHRGLSRWIAQRRNRLRAKRRALEIRRHQADLDEHIGWLVADYTRAVQAEADRHELSALLTGLSGCLLAESSRWYAQGYATEAEEYRLSGLLVAEVAVCASENPSVSDPPDFRGPRAPEFQAQEITDALHELALAYRNPQLEDEELVVWGCLSALIEAVVETNPVMPGTWPGPVILGDMSDAHFAVECPDPPEPTNLASATRRLEEIRSLIREVQQFHCWTRAWLASVAAAAVAYVAIFVAWIIHPSTTLDLARAITEAAVCVLAAVAVGVGVWQARRSADSEPGGSA